MSTRFYDTDLTDAAWAWVAPVLPAARTGGRPRTTNLRAVLNAIFYLLRTGCQWRLLPREFPPCGAVCHYFQELCLSSSAKRSLGFGLEWWLKSKRLTSGALAQCSPRTGGLGAAPPMCSAAWPHFLKLFDDCSCRSQFQAVQLALFLFG